MISVLQRNAIEAEALLATAWRSTNDQTSIVRATVAEHIRSILYGAFMAQRDASAPRAVHTTRLLTNARRMLELIWPRYMRRAAFDDEQSEEDDVCSAVLGQLRLLGDSHDTGGGQWIAAPLRIVTLGDAKTKLVVGAAPVPVVRHHTGASPVCAGQTRFISAQKIEIENNRDLLQSADIWLGEIAPLPEWTSQVLTIHETRMHTVEGLSSEQLEIYAPDMRRDHSGQGRWIASAQISRLPAGPRLCRVKDSHARNYDRPHYLAHFELKGGAVVLRRCASIAHDLTLRLRFGLDIALKTPRALSITISGQNFAIDRPPTLPSPESRIYALGWRDQSASPSSQKLLFHSDAMPFVMHAFQRLGLDTSRASRRPS